MPTLLLGDCLEQLKELDNNSIDSIVTDPPYGLSFMGKKWDYDVPSIAIWEECLRVLKPGGHLLAFGGTRTYHRLVVNIEDAGFEIRDQIQWLYGSGFPKSTDVAKRIDKEAGAIREVIGFDKTCRLASNKNLNDDNWEKIGTQGAPITKAKSEDAIKYQGWGTALKPANEPICVARKPLEKGLTLAANVLKYGTGAINIDESRIDYTSEADKASATPQGKVTSKKPEDGYAKAAGLETERHEIERPELKGRWPANVLFGCSCVMWHKGLHPKKAQTHEPNCAVAMLDEQSGHLHGRQNKKTKESVDVGMFGNGIVRKNKSSIESIDLDKGGGASRFFYVAKASKSERNKGLEGMPLKAAGVMDDDSYVWAKNGDGSERNKKVEPRQNFHPTVKPIKLMEYLIRLVTPKGGVTLDPFMGSGSTGVAAKNLGFKFVGIEMNPEYFEIAFKRIGVKESKKSPKPKQMTFYELIK